MNKKTLMNVLDFWNRNNYPDNIMESQRDFNRKAFEISRKSVEKWLSEIGSDED